MSGREVKVLQRIIRICPVPRGGSFLVAVDVKDAPLDKTWNDHSQASLGFAPACFKVVKTEALREAVRRYAAFLGLAPPADFNAWEDR